MQADTERQQNGRSFDITRNGGNAFLHQVLRVRVRQHAVEGKVTQQAQYKHAVAQNRRHSLGVKRCGQHLHQGDEQHDPGGKTQRKSQHAVRRLLAEYAEYRAYEGSGTRK